jgi:hypothetical protein
MVVLALIQPNNLKSGIIKITQDTISLMRLGIKKYVMLEEEHLKNSNLIYQELQISIKEFHL